MSDRYHNTDQPNGKHCKVCGAALKGRQSRYCSGRCYHRMHNGRLAAEPKAEPPPMPGDDPAFVAAWGLRDWSMHDFDSKVR